VGEAQAVAANRRSSFSLPRLQGEALTTLMPYLYCLVLGGVLLATKPDLLFGPGALDIRATAVLPLALVAVGQTFAIFTRGIDLALGGIISTTTALLATHLTGTGALLWLELVAVVAMGAFGGFVNGMIIARTSLQPFIVTLATWSVWSGIAILILPQEGGAVSPDLNGLAIGSIAGLPKSVLLVALLFAAWGRLRTTRLILDLKAIGSDERRAELVGVPIRRRKVQTYIISGALAALAGIWLAGQAGGGSPVVGNDYILESVAAVVIGGTSIFGGTGSAASSIAGAVALLMIPDLIYAFSISSFWTGFVQGVLLIATVTISSLLLRSRRRQL
jgi:ribose transport system permease protein